MLRWLKFSVVAFVGCGFIGMIAYALWMREEIRSAQIEPPLIAAPEIALKRRPEEPGGMEIPNRDKLVFDLLDNSASATLPAPAPVDEELADNGVETVSASVTAAANQPVTLPQSRVEHTADQLAMAHLVASADTLAQDESVKINPVSKTTQVAALPMVAEQEQSRKAIPVPDVPKAGGGVWGVQLGAVGTQDDAINAAKTLQNRFQVLKALTPRTSRVVSGNSARYRIQFFGIATRSSAMQICDQLGSKQPCFPVGG